jgi:hypothetical protein
MAKLATTARKRIPKSSFAIPSKKPGSGSYPIPDKCPQCAGARQPARIAG